MLPSHLNTLTEQFPVNNEQLYPDASYFSRTSGFPQCKFIQILRSVFDTYDISVNAFTYLTFTFSR